jgi:uncharacterized membrane protein
MANGEKRLLVVTLIMFIGLLLYTLWMILQTSREGDGDGDQPDKKSRKNMKVDLTPIDVPPQEPSA